MNTKKTIVFLAIAFIIGCKSSQFSRDNKMESLKKTEIIHNLLMDSVESKTLASSDYLQKESLSKEEVGEAIRLIDDYKDYRAYHLLFAVKKADFPEFEAIPIETKSKILVSALQNQKALNDWFPVPGIWDCVEYSTEKVSYGEPTEMLIKMGRKAIPALRTELRNESRASYYGSSESTDLRMQDIERGDVAYLIVREILHPNDKMYVYLKSSRIDRDIQKSMLEQEIENEKE